MSKYAVRYETCSGRDWRPIVKEREFDSAIARERFLERIGKKDNFIGVVAFSDPLPPRPSAFGANAFHSMFGASPAAAAKLNGRTK